MGTESIAASAECWEGLAEDWSTWAGHLADGLAPVRAWLVRELAPRPTDTVLELAAGNGDTGFAAAELLTGGGRLISTDASPAMVDVARRRGMSRALPDVEWRVLDAQALALPADSVDGVLCQNGLMLMDDPAAALAEVRRVLRPGGRLAFSVWATTAHQIWAEGPRGALVELGLLDPRVEELPDPAGLSDAGRTAALLRGAGFTSVHSEELAIHFRFADLAELERWSLEISSIAEPLRALSEPDREAWRTRLAEVLAPYTDEQGALALPGVSLVTVTA